MRIVGGTWRGRHLRVPPGQTTRPTADRVRQALFDMLTHAPWGGRTAIEGARVLDVFAGTGALGLEALSRGAASACFIEQDPVTLEVLRANVVACGAESRVQIIAADALAVGGHPPQNRLFVPVRARTNTQVSSAAQRLVGREEAELVFLDPPYAQGFLTRAIEHLSAAGWIAPDALIVAECGRRENWTPRQSLLAEREHGAARVMVFRMR